MIGRLLRIFFLFALTALIVRHLFGRRQKCALDEVVRISARVLLAASAATLLIYLLAA